MPSGSGAHPAPQAGGRTCPPSGRGCPPSPSARGERRLIMGSTVTCTRCGLPVAPDKVGGLCPACLIDATFAAEPPGADEGPAFWEDPLPAPKTSGRTFSHFDLLDELGRGGMGVVYRARDLTTERIVALKVLQAHHLEVDDLVQRFRSEVRAVSSLDHPHVLPIHEVGEHDGIPFFSMKLTTGGSLAHNLGSYLGRPLEAARLLAKVSRGVQHAHERGILHRDLKPGNILLDAAGEPYVCDFGLAKWIEDDKKLTLTAAVLGTPHYIAPEQALGSKGLTTAVDIYSLGAILYELLTGRPPFVGATVLETLVASQDKTPERPSSLAHNIPRDLETICLKALQHDPNNRYASARAFAEDLEAWLGGRPIQARPVGAAEQLWRWAKRNPFPATLVALLLLTLVAIALGSTLAAVRIDRERNRALAAEAAATTSAEAAREQLYTALLAQARAARLTGRPGQRLDALRALQEAAAIHSTLDLRNEAIAALTLLDVQSSGRRTVRTDSSQRLAFDSTLESVFVVEERQRIVRRPIVGGEPVQIGDALGGEIARIEVTADLLAVRYSNHALRVWDLRASTWVFSQPPAALAAPLRPRPEWSLLDFCIAADGSRLAYAAHDGTVRTRLLAGTANEAVHPVPAPALCLAMDAPGGRLAVGLSDSTEVLVLDVSSNRLLQRLKVAAEVKAVQFSPDGQLLGFGCADGSVYLASLEDGEITRLDGHRQNVTQVLFAPDGRLLASTGQDRTLRFWSVSTRSEQLTVGSLGAEPVLTFSKDGRRIAATDFATAAEVLSLTDLEEVCAPRRSPFANDWATLVSSLDFAPDGKTLAVASFTGVSLWESASARLLLRQELDPKAEKNVRYLPDGSLLLASKRSGLWRLENTAKPTLQRLPVAVLPGIWGSAVSPEGALLCINDSTTPQVQTLDTKTLEVRETVPVSPGVWDAVAPRASAWLAVAYSGVSGRSVEILTRGASAAKALPTGPGSTLTLSPNERWLVCTGDRGCLLVDTQTWEAVSWLPPVVAAEAGRAAFSPDGALLACSADDKVYLVAIPSGQLLAVLESRQQASNTYRVRFSPDGRQLATQGVDGSLRLWNLEALRERLRALKLAW